MQRGNLEAAAANYSYMRGLFGIPLGVLVILAALVNWGVCPLWAFFLAVAVIGAACLPIARYYNENYGRLSPSMRQGARGTVGSRHRRAGSRRRVVAATRPGGRVG